MIVLASDLLSGEALIVVFATVEIVFSTIFQLTEAICWYRRYASPASNNPTITATSLTTFFNAYPRSSPPKNPPSITADRG